MIKVYLTDVSNLPDPIENPEILVGLTEERKEKAKRYKQLKDRKQCVGAGLLLKKCLLDQNIDITKLHIGKNGKPEIGGIYFNLSHSHDMVACAVSNKPVGCDIEKIGKARFKVAEHFFTENEIRYLNLFSEEEKKKEFYRLWTIKESYIKMTGEGTTIPLNSFEVIFREKVEIFRNGKLCDCHINEYEVQGYKLAVCGEEREFSNSVERRKVHDKN